MAKRKTVTRLSAKELKRLTKVLTTLENTERRNTFPKRSGAFACADMVSYDDAEIIVSLEVGIKDGEEDRTYHNTLIFDRKTMKELKDAN